MDEKDLSLEMNINDELTTEDKNEITAEGLESVGSEEKTLFDYTEEDLDQMILEMHHMGEKYLEEKYGRPFRIYRTTPGRSIYPGCVIGYATPTENESQNFRMIFVPDSGLVSDEFVNSCAEESVKDIFEKSIKAHFEKYVIKVDVNGHFCNGDDPETDLATYLSMNPEKQFRIYLAVDSFDLMETTPETIYQNLASAVSNLKRVKGEIVLSYVDEEKLGEIIQYMNFFTKIDTSYEDDILEGFFTQVLSFEGGHLNTTVEEFTKEYEEV